MRHICPICGNCLSVEYKIEKLNGISFASISVDCGCGFKVKDVVIFGNKLPSKYTLKITSGEDLKTKIIKSSNCSIEIPEIGIKVEPDKLEGRITDTEGVLKEVLEVLSLYKSFLEDGKEKKHLNDMIKCVYEAMEGKRKLTLILEDPSGNTKIFSENAEREILMDKSYG